MTTKAIVAISVRRFTTCEPEHPTVLEVEKETNCYFWAKRVRNEESRFTPSASRMDKKQMYFRRFGSVLEAQEFLKNDKTYQDWRMKHERYRSALDDESRALALFREEAEHNFEHGEG